MNLRELFKLRVHEESEHQFFRLVFENYYEKIYKTIFLITRDQELSKEMVQETFIKVMTSINQLKDPSKFEPWLYTIATNKARDGLRVKIRENKKIIKVEDMIKVPKAQPIWQNNFLLPEYILEQKELHRKLIEAINQVDYKYKEVLVLKYFLGLSEKEIIETTNINEGTIKSRLNRARTKIYSLLKDYFYGESQTEVKKVE